MVKWIDTCQVSQEVFFSPRQPACPPTAGATFPFCVWQALPFLQMPVFPAVLSEHQQQAKETQDRFYGHMRAISFFSPWIPETTIKKTDFKRSHVLPLMHQDI